VEPPESPQALPIEPMAEEITEEERSLRIAEAEVLFPNYMSAVDYRQGNRAKRSKPGPKSPLLYLPLDKKYLKECQEKHFPHPAASPMVPESGPVRHLVEHFTPTKGQSYFMEQADLGREVDSAWYSPRELLAAKALLQFS
jgi:hypothetical protein